MAERWSGRLATLRAMAALSAARLLITFIPFYRWRSSLGGNAPPPPTPLQLADTVSQAKRLARQVEWAAHRLPFETKCLPRAMALSWILRAEHIGHVLVLAARPAELRHAPNALHAWIEIGRTKVIGDLPGPWIESLRLDRETTATTSVSAG